MNSDNPLRLDPRHIPLFLQILLLVGQVILSVWYFVVMVSPGSVSEYLPPEIAATPTNILAVLPVSVFWIVLIYATLKWQRGLLVSLAVAVSFVILIPLIYLTKYLVPDFDDFLSFATLVLLSIFSARGYRFESKEGKGPKRPFRVTSWQAATLLQFLFVVIQITIVIWFLAENYFPNSLSELLPPEVTFSIPSLGFLVVTVIYLWSMLFLTMRGRRSPLLVSAIVGCLLFVLAPAGFLFGFAKPNFSDFLEIPLFPALVIYNAKAYMDFPKTKRQ
jgi:hypothetical protein